MEKLRGRKISFLCLMHKERRLTRLLEKSAAQIQKLAQALLVSLYHFLNHLAADGACLTGGQVAVVTIGEVHTDFIGCLHLELFHTGLCFGDINLIVALHNHFLLLYDSQEGITS